MTAHALILAALVCLAQPRPEALACLNANPEIVAHAEMLAGLVAATPCARSRSCKE